VNLTRSDRDGLVYGARESASRLAIRHTHRFGRLVAADVGEMRDREIGSAYRVMSAFAEGGTFRATQA